MFQKSQIAQPCTKRTNSNIILALIRTVLIRAAPVITIMIELGTGFECMLTTVGFGVLERKVTRFSIVSSDSYIENLFRFHTLK